MLEWLAANFGPGAADTAAYVTNGAHLAWYASFRFTVTAALAGGALALLFGLGGAALRSSPFLPLRVLGGFYSGIVRGVPDVLFFLFFPLAFEQGVEALWASATCTPEALAGNPGVWPPCPEVNWRLGTPEYLVLACVSLGLVYGAFATNVIHGAMQAVPRGQLEAARAFGFSQAQVFWRFQIRQMWIYALPGLSNVWLLLIKATALLSLLQIADIVLWADRLGAPNFNATAGLVHPDWRWRYYLVLFLFYILVTLLSERFFRALTRRAGRGLVAEG